MTIKIIQIYLKESDGGFQLRNDLVHVLTMIFDQRHVPSLVRLGHHSSLEGPVSPAPRVLERPEAQVRTQHSHVPASCCRELADSDGKPQVEKGTYLTTWRKQKDGTWKVVSDVGSPDPE